MTQSLSDVFYFSEILWFVKIEAVRHFKIASYYTCYK